MKRIQRINRVTQRPPRRRNRFILFAVIAAAGGLALQFVVVGALLAVAGVGVANYYNSTTTQGLTRLRQAPALVGTQPTRILDRHGRLLVQLTDTRNGLHQYVSLSKMPRNMIWAIISAEDKTFYSNPGIEPAAIARSLRADLQAGGTAQGASTLTQQVVKTMVLTNQKSYLRKIQEMMIAYAVAQPGSGFSKDRILSMYLNNVFFGEQSYGVEAAARVFFGKHIWQLDLAQCALLAGLVQAPTAYDPLGRNGPQAAIDRMDYVLERMWIDGHITKEQYEAAKAEGGKFVFSYPQLRPTVSRSAAPYWTDWIEHLLTYNFGPLQKDWYTDPVLTNLVANNGGLYSGLTITTTLDLDTYNQAQTFMNNRVAQLAGRNVNDAAVVVLQPNTAECLAMVGGLDYYSNATGSLINMAAYPRQPGSSFKLFTYTTALEKGWYPSKIILDEQQTWPDPSEPSGVYAPENYDHSWHGAVTMRIALSNSYNVPAVKTIDAIGVQPVFKTAEAMGVTDLIGQEKGAGLSTTLGSKEVSLWQMAQAYNVMANGGVLRPMASVLGIGDAEGNVLYTYKVPAGQQVIAPQYAYLMTSMLKDNYARTRAFGYNSWLQLDRPAAVKTGTSQDFKDNLTIGYTPNLLTATWVGNPDDSAMNNVEGVDGAGPIWNDVMEYGFKHFNLSQEDFIPPPGIVIARVSSSGYLADSNTVWPITDLFAAGTVPHQYDPGGEENYSEYRVLSGDFSLDGGTTGAGISGVVPFTTTGAVVTGVPNGGVPGSTGPVVSGSGGLLTQRPDSNADLCGGRSWTYQSVYINGQLRWQYTCH